MIWQKKWILGNWKMNGRSNSVADFAAGLARVAIPDGALAGVAVPLAYAAQCRQALPQGFWCGVQDISRFSADGAFTGEVSAAMCADMGMDFAIIGHSERRRYFGEEGRCLEEKVCAAAESGLVPVFCVGEQDSDRGAGRAQEVVGEQLSVLYGKNLNHIVIAYEPVWAIGSGRAAEPEQIAEMHAFIYREVLSNLSDGASIRILYGGSVNAANASVLLGLPFVDGALVGGASMQIDSFAGIISGVN